MVVVVMTVAVLRWKLVVLTQSMHAHTHSLVRSETAVLPLLVPAAAELGFAALAPLLG